MLSADFEAAWGDEPSEAVAERIEWLLAQLNQSCSCAPELQFVRLRTLENGSKHHVIQCTGCGEQRGNALGGKDAKARLGGRVAQAFDDEVHTVYVGKRRALSDEYTAVHKLWMSRERPDVLPGLRAARETEEACAERVKATMSQCVAALLQDVDEATAADVLAKHAIATRQRHWHAQLTETERFKTEPELKTWLESYLSEDFVLTPEVVGKHMAEGVRVQIDYVAYPRPHLIEQGFVPDYFGIEAKYLDQVDGFSHKASRGIWQTVSYTDSTFFIDQEWRRLKFALLFSNLAFEAERGLLKCFGAQREDDRATWHALLQLANHANVGALEIEGTRRGWKGWKMAFSGGSYFRRCTRGGKAVYALSDVNTINKVRIGNF